MESQQFEKVTRLIFADVPLEKVDNLQRLLRELQSEGFIKDDSQVIIDLTQTDNDKVHQ